MQEGINAVPDFRKNKTVNFIKNGTYKEKLTLPTSKAMVTFMGEDVKSTILAFDDIARKKTIWQGNRYHLGITK